MFGKFSYSIVFLIASISVSAQSIDRYVINNCGIVNINPSLEVVTSFGESIVGEEQGKSYSGFLVPDSLPQAISINEMNFENQTSVYPNPCSSFFTLKGDSEFSNVEIINAIGEVKLNQKMYGKEVRIKTSHLDEGVYFLRVYFVNNFNPSIRKIIVQH